MGTARGSLDDHAVAAAVADRAGQLLVDLRQSGLAPDRLRDAADQRSHDLIIEELSAYRPDDAVLSEEAIDDQARLTRPRVWIVDPLDGTREYGEVDRSDWAVHVALVVDGVLTAGAVALPARGVTLSTGAPPAPRPRADGPLRVVVSRTRPPPLAPRLAARLDAELVPMGSAGAKVAAVVMGDVDVYAHSGGQYEWDSAAPVAVALAAGFHASRLDGSRLRYNQPDPSLPDLLVCRAELAEPVLAAIEELNA